VQRKSKKDLNDLQILLSNLKRSLKGRKLSRTDRLLLDIISKMTDILTSGLKEKQAINTKRRTSTTSTQEIRNEVLSLRDFLRSRGGSDRRE